MYENGALIFKALADETRLEILHMLTQGERCFSCNSKQDLIQYKKKWRGNRKTDNR